MKNCYIVTLKNTNTHKLRKVKLYAKTIHEVIDFINKDYKKEKTEIIYGIHEIVKEKRGD